MQKPIRVILGIDIGWRTLSVAKIVITHEYSFKVVSVQKQDIGSDLSVQQILCLIPKLTIFDNSNDVTNVIIEEQVPMAGAQLGNIRAYGMACGIFMHFVKEKKDVVFFNNKYKFTEARRIGYILPETTNRSMTASQKRTITKNNALWLTTQWLKHSSAQTLSDNRDIHVKLIVYFESKPKAEKYDEADALSIALSYASSKDWICLDIPKEDGDYRQLKYTDFVYEHSGPVNWTNVAKK